MFRVCVYRACGGNFGDSGMERLGLEDSRLWATCLRPDGSFSDILRAPNTFPKGPKYLYSRISGFILWASI